MDQPKPHILSKYPGRPIREVEAEITELAGHLNAANHHWLMLIAEFDDRNGWADWATQSCAHWLNWKCGMAMRAAREKVRVAHALQKLPFISRAMEKGELSYSKVRELTRVASEATEEALLMTARYGTAQHVETLVRHFRRCKEVEELSREAQQQVNRFMSFHYEDDGSLVLKARLPAEAGAVVLKALGLAIEELPKEESEGLNVSSGPAGPSTIKSTLRVRRADALALIAESFVRHGAEEMSGGDKYQIVMHVSEETLKSREAGRCEFEDGTAISAETARRCACDASVVTLTEDEEGNPLDIGRKTRSIPPAMKRALNSRDKGCRFPGCCNKTYVDGHHVKHWASGGETKLGNLVTLCRFHHHRVHEGGVRVQILDDGVFRFVKPNGESFDSVSPGHTSDWTEVPKLSRRSGIVISRQTAETKWRGESMDYGLAVQVLLQRDARARNASVGTDG